MSDIISSASLLVATITIIYSLWYPDIVKDINVKIPPPAQKIERDRTRTKVGYTKYWRSLPLSIIALLVTLIFLPETIHILWDTIAQIWGQGFYALYDYNPVQASLVMVTIISLLLTVHLFYLTHQLWLVMRKLNPSEK